MPRGQARFRDLLAKKLDAVLLPGRFVVETLKELVRVRFRQKVRNKHSRPIAWQQLTTGGE
jgi:ABC-type uncharacterized transport system permease subunit